MSAQTDFRQIIIDTLDILRIEELKLKEMFKANAYKKVIQELKNINKPVYSIDDLTDVKGIGSKIKLKIEEIIETGKLKKAEKVKESKEYSITDKLLKIYGIGPSKANELINKHHISSIEELREKQDLLNDKQKIGLKHYEDFLLRIPRSEMDEHYKYIFSILKYISKDFEVEIVGSYRRLHKDSGDIDVLITHKSSKIINDPTLMERIIIKALNKKFTYLTDILAVGPKMCLAVCKLPNSNHYRRIDFLLTSPEEYPYALLYFTGNDKFNVDLRNRAIEMRHSLSQHGLKNIDTNEMVKGLKTEKDILGFLKMNYVEPENRT
jgi:DNA polymerase/3'-5' exonuclease PolX